MCRATRAQSQVDLRSSQIRYGLRRVKTMAEKVFHASRCLDWQHFLLQVAPEPVWCLGIL